MALEIKSHGGSCCGVRHIKNFHLPTPRRVFNYDRMAYDEQPAQEITPKLIDELINGKLLENGRRTGGAVSPRPGDPKDDNGGRTRGKVIEAIITDTQFRNYPSLAQTMKDAGFKLVTRFSNNTGGMCNILHRVTGGRDIQQAARRNPHIRTLIS